MPADLRIAEIERPTANRVPDRRGVADRLGRAATASTPATRKSQCPDEQRGRGRESLYHQSILSGSCHMKIAIADTPCTFWAGLLALFLGVPG